LEYFTRAANFSVFSWGHGGSTINPILGPSAG
jgi:hypothetical protein